jgi:acetylornithine deacetylase
VRQPSTLGNEAGVQELVLARMKSLGLKAEKWDLDVETLRSHPSFGSMNIGYANRPNVTARWPAAAPGGRSLILNGHIDVVSPGALADWARDPWEPVIEDDWMYGRGAADMKSGIAAMLLAVEAIRAAGCRLRGDLILETVIEEECTGNGSLACAARGLRADAALLPECSGLRASLATVGVIWFRVRVQGRAGHALATSAAVNAIEKMPPILVALRELEEQLNAEANHPHYANVRHPINLNIGTIRGGEWPSSVPADCSVECRLACLPVVTVEQTEERIRVAVSAAAERDEWLRTCPPTVEFFGFRASPSVVDPTAESMRLLADCHAEVSGAPLLFAPGTATTDQRFFLNELNMPATSYGPKGENIHAANERVFIPSILQTARVAALFCVRWCGLLTKEEGEF